MTLKEYEIRGMCTPLDIRSELPKIRYATALHDLADFDELTQHNAAYIMCAILTDGAEPKTYFAEGFRHETLKAILEDIEGAKLEDDAWHPGQLGIDSEDKIRIIDFKFDFGTSKTNVKTILKFFLQQINPDLFSRPFVSIRLSGVNFYKYHPYLKRLTPQEAAKTYLK